MSDKKLPANHYVDGKKFTKAMAEYEIQRNNFVPTTENEICPPSDYISECIILIAENHVHSTNFIKNGVDVNSLVSEAIWGMLNRGLRNFSIKESKNAFAYFSQIAYYAYLAYLIKEQTEYKKKCKWIQSNPDQCVSLIDEVNTGSYESLNESISKLQEYLEFDFSNDNDDESSRKTRQPLYLQNRTDEERQAVKDRRRKKKIVVEKESVLDKLLKGDE